MASSEAVAGGIDSEKRKSPLSPRETQLLQALSEGYTRAEIASKWGVSVGTIHNHIRVIHAKLGAKTTAQALAAALRQSWI